MHLYIVFIMYDIYLICKYSIKENKARLNILKRLKIKALLTNASQSVDVVQLHKHLFSPKYPSYSNLFFW